MTSLAAGDSVCESVDILTDSIDLITQHLCSDFIFVLKFDVQIHTQFCLSVAVFICSLH